MTKAPLSIIDFCRDPQLLNLSLSPAQTVLLKAIYGMALGKDERALYTQCTGRTTYRAGAPFAEVTVVAGARSGKDSRIAAPVVLYEAIWGGHDRRLAKGECGVIALVAQDKDATRVAFTYIRDYLMDSPHLRTMVADEPLAQEIQLTNRLKIVCFPCSQKSLRAWSIPCAVLDELAYFRLEGGANSDVEIQSSVRRGMIGFGPHTRLVKISTPYMRDGILFDDHKRAWGQPDPDLLVWKASTALMNPSIAPARLERERRLDPQRYAREYEAEFAEDLESFLPSAWIEAAIVGGRFMLPARPDCWYSAAVDPSGGGADAFALSLCHAVPSSGDDEDGRVTIVQDVLKSWARSRSAAVNLEAIVTEAADLLTAYAVTAVIGDRYSAGWVKQAFARRGILYLDAPEKSAAYQDVEPLFAQGAIQLLDHPQQQRELTMLERRPRPGGKPLIDHPRGGHDDHANVLALAAAAALATATAPPADPRPDEGELAQLQSAFPGLEIARFDDEWLR